MGTNRLATRPAGDAMPAINMLALVKGGERYVFMYDDDNHTEIMRQLGRFAANPELSFTWYDAWQVSVRIREACDG